MTQRSRTPWARAAWMPPAAAVIALAAHGAVSAADAGNAPGASMDGARSGAAQGAASTRSQDASQYHAMRASQLIGMNVVNGRGDNVGEIADLVVDTNTSSLRYAVLSFDPGILSAERLFAVPIERLRLPGAERRQAVYDVDRDQLERASFARSDWTERFLTDEDKVRRLDQAWNVKQPTDGATAHRVSDLIGEEVENRNGENIGEIEDVVVDLSGRKVHYAVLDFDDGWATADKYYAFPLKALQVSGERDDVVLDIDKSRLQQMRGFDDARLSDLDDSNWVGELDRNMRGEAGSAATTAAMTGTDRFRRLDANDDRLLTREEARADTVVERDWSTLDRDGDGRLSRQEFDKGFEAQNAPR